MTPQLNKTQWPGYITDALGIPSVMGRGGPWHSTGDTTDVAWFHAICEYLGIEYPKERIRAMKAVIESLGGTWDVNRHSSAGAGKVPGGNVRKEAFEDLWNLLHQAGKLSPADRPQPGADELAVDRGQAEQWAYRNIRLRQGQPEFRARLLAAYDNRCAISSADVSQALEACHIAPHAAGGSMATSNGILLRGDLHTLFDLRLIAVDTSAWQVIVHPTVRATAVGDALHGTPFRLPSRPSDRPSTAALDSHRQRSGID